MDTNNIMNGEVIDAGNTNVEDKGRKASHKTLIGIVSLFAVLSIVTIVLLLFSFKPTETNNATSNNTVVVVDGRVAKSANTSINLTNLTDENSAELKYYSADDYEEFLADYKNDNLPVIYVSEFLFDGAGMYKTFDLDDFIEEGNDVKVKAYSGTVININMSGTIELSGELTDGMIAVNSNFLSEDLAIVLNGVKIDTDSKKVPAIFVYNKDITFDTAKVTIVAKEGTKNYIEGGKLKKVSLMDSEALSSYASVYSGTTKTQYNSYTNYYGVYSSDEISQVLFAMVQASNEDLADGDPYLFYKGAGAISSDIDLNFEGEGYLEVISKNKEGIETKGNLSFTGGTGDYVILAEDDCLNTTTKSNSGTNVHNALYIDVNSLVAVVSLDADEGDAIDSNGTLTIDGGTIIAIAKPGADAGLDSETGTYINGGTVIATGDMYDQINSASKQEFLAMNLGGNTAAGDTFTLIDEGSNALFSYITDRTFQNLIYSSSKLNDSEYELYRGGEVTGEANYGFIDEVDGFDGGTKVSYSTSDGMGGPGGMGGGPGGMGGPGDEPMDGRR